MVCSIFKVFSYLLRYLLYFDNTFQGNFRNIGMKMKRYILIFLMLCLSGVILFADKNISREIKKLEKKIVDLKDKKRVDTLIELSHLYLSKSPKKTVAYAKEALELSKKLKYELGKARSLRMLGNSYLSLGKNKKALISFNKSINLCKEIGNKKEIADTFNSIGNYYLRLGKNDKAEEYYNESLKIRKELKDRKGIADNLNNLGIIFDNKGELKQALNYYKQSLKIREKLGNKKDVAGSFSNIGNIYEHLGDLKQSLQYHLESLGIRKKIGDKDGISISTNNIGLVHWRLSNYDDAIDNFLKSLKISKEMGKKKGIGICYHNIGMIYSQVKKYNKSLEYSLNALDIFKQLKFKYAIGASLDNIGNIYDNLNEVEKSLKYHLEALKIREEIGDRKGIATTSSNIGNRYKTLKKYKKALRYYNKSLSIDRDIGNKSGVAYNLINVGGLYTIQNNYDKGFYYLNQSLKIAIELKDKSLIQLIYKGFSDSYYDLKKYKKAFDYFKRYSEVKDKISSKETNDKISELEISFETEKKEKQIVLLKKNGEIQKLELSRERLKATIFIIGFILALIVLFIFLWLYLHFRKFWKRKNYIGHYKIGKRVGGGAMGDVFKAINVMEDSKPVALKILKEEHKNDEKLKNRFKNEATIIDQLDHPNVIKVYERGEINQRLYIAMEFLDGRSLEEIIRSTDRLSIKDCLEIMHQVAKALSAIHNQGVYHCDIKPGNIMLTKRNSNELFAKLLDFDIARSQNLSSRTEKGYLMGTICYLSPEYIAHQEITAASDIYSFGVVCYELLTSEHPFMGDTAGSILRQIQEEDPFEARGFRPEISKELNDFIKKMLNKNPVKRPDGHELLTTIEKLYRMEVSNA